MGTQSPEGGSVKGFITESGNRFVQILMPDGKENLYNVSNECQLQLGEILGSLPDPGEYCGFCPLHEQRNVAETISGAQANPYGTRRHDIQEMAARNSLGNSEECGVLDGMPVDLED